MNPFLEKVEAALLSEDHFVRHYAVGIFERQLPCYT